MPDKSLLFYCQHLLGVGHLARSLALTDALAEEFQVTLVQGGPDVGLAPKAKGVEVVRLAPLLMRETDDKSLYDPEGKRSVDAILADRAERLASLAFRKWDEIVVELFPFGRRKFQDEIMDLIAAARSVNPNVRVHCSLRDILVEKSGQAERDERTAALVNSAFDSVLVHSDPDVVRLEESFVSTAAIADRLRYTGFVAERRAAMAVPAELRANRVLVSQGGGAIGGELLRAALETARLLPELEFAFILGPHAPAAERAEIASGILALPNAVLLPFGAGFEAELARSALSLSLGGYNTVMNLLNTRTYGLVYPYGKNREQGLRADRLAARGFLSVLRESSLEPGALAARIREALAHRYPDGSVRLGGARATAEILARGDAR